MAGEIEWIEPSWSIRQRRSTFRSIPRVVFRDAGRIMAAAVLVGAGVMLALYLSGEPYVEHVSKVLLVISALLIVIVLFAVVQVIVDRFIPPAKIAVSAGKILVSGALAFSSAADETVTILRDSKGRGWLVIQRQSVRLQFGVPTEVSLAEVEQLLRST